MSENKLLVGRLAERFGVDANKFFETLKVTAFKQRDGSAPTNEQMMVLLIVADQYNLNPFTKELYAFPDKHNGIIPVVSVDGWSRITNEHREYSGVEFVYSDGMVQMDGAKVECNEWVECVMYRRDRQQPIRIREYLDEVYRAPIQGSGRNGAYTVEGPWQTHPKRMLRHKAFIQCSRMAFSFGGIFDSDEAESIVDIQATSTTKPAVAMQNQSAEFIKPITIGYQEVDIMLQKLMERARKENSWSAVHDYAKKRLDGLELEYVIQSLHEAEKANAELGKVLQNTEQSKVKSKGKNAQTKTEDEAIAGNQNDGIVESSFATREDFILQ